MYNYISDSSPSNIFDCVTINIFESLHTPKNKPGIY